MKYTNYVITHKSFNCPKLENYIPLQVGFNNDLNYKRDNTDDNISYKNQSFCELTGIYWIWKNDIDSDFVGISHYRRYFTKSRLSYSYKQFLNVNDIENILKDHDIILANKHEGELNLIEQYCDNSGYLKDLNVLRNTIIQYYPDYLESYDNVMNGTTFSPFNMLITKKSIYDNYCSWLFNILFDVEKQIDISSYDNYKKRIYGFMSERLLNVWVKHNNLKIKYCRVVNPECSFDEKTNDLLNRIRYKLEK